MAVVYYNSWKHRRIRARHWMRKCGVNVLILLTLTITGLIIGITAAGILYRIANSLTSDQKSTPSHRDVFYMVEAWHAGR